jgi:DNA invertase Pin-like site-specific DNA recombinase
MKAALYARVSTKDKGQDTANQLFQLREYCTRQGWQVVEEYIDHESAKSGDRAAFKRLFTDASRRKFDVVVVWALDRFTREGVFETFTYIEKLRGFKIAFESYTEAHFRTTGPAGALMLAVPVSTAVDSYRCTESIPQKGPTAVMETQSAGVAVSACG